MENEFEIKLKNDIQEINNFIYFYKSKKIDFRSVNLHLN